jgi:hypothetical protein
LTISAALVKDTLGRPIDGGHNVLATLTRTGLVISASAAATPQAAAVDALLERGLIP